MKIRLWIKLSVSFFVVILVFGMILTLLTRNMLEEQFTRYIEEGDIRLSRQIAGLLTDEISHTYGSRQVSEQQFITMLADEPDVPPMRHMRDGPVMGLPFFSAMMQRGRGMPQSIAVTDTHGNIRKVYGTISVKGPVRTDRGIPVFSKDTVVGYVFAGTMLDEGLDEYHREMLSSIDQSIITAALIAFAVSLVVSILVFAHIISPVSALGRAADAIGKGDYRARVRVKRRDELGDLSRTFNAMAESIEQSEIWKRRVISDSAHELRTPVALLAAEVEMLIEGVYTPDADQFSHMQREIQQLSQLIDELQNLSSIESGTANLELEHCSLCSFLDQVIGIFSAVAEKKQVSITRQQCIACGYRPLSGDVELSFDRRRMQQVFANVTANALRYVPHQGTVDITCSVSSGGEIVVSIEDSGPGIPPEKRDRVFDRFFRVEGHRSRETGGAGLGLAISREIMSLHGGCIRAVEPVSLGGARIEILLPAARD